METTHLRTRSLTAVIAALLCTCTQAFAQHNNCTTEPSAASCGLDSTAHLLRIAAAILGVVLLVSMAAAVAIYRRNKNRKLTPDE